MMQHALLIACDALLFNPNSKICLQEESDAADKTFADTAGLCPTPNKTVPAYQPGGYCPTYVYDGNFCASSQPSWSAFREPAYGHGILTFENSTHAYWQWNRNLDNENIEMDTVYVIRQLSCSNKAGY